jgi:hypothetical protein
MPASARMVDGDKVQCELQKLSLSRLVCIDSTRGIQTLATGFMY